MTTNYHGSLDSYTTKVDGVDDVVAAHVNDLQDAVVAIEGVLGEEGNNGICEGRLTLTSGNPVATADQTAQTTVYFTPYKGNRISLYDGSASWDTLHFTEKSVSVPATTNTPFDIFAYNDGGTVALEAVSWTNDTTRATALTTQDGVYVKSGATTRRYLGTGRTTSVSGQTENSLSKRFLWNYYHRIRLLMWVIDSTSHTYATASYRAWNNDTSVRVNWVVGVAEIYARYEVQTGFLPASGEANGYVGLGIDTASTSSLSQPALAAPVANLYHLASFKAAAASLGAHYAQIVEFGGAPSPDFLTAQAIVEIEG